MEKITNIGGRLHSVATGNIIAGANEIIDDDKNKKQSDINKEVDLAIAALNGAIGNTSNITEGEIEALREQISEGGYIDKKLVDASKKIAELSNNIEIEKNIRRNYDNLLSLKLDDIKGGSSSNIATLEDKVTESINNSKSEHLTLRGKLNALRVDVNENIRNIEQNTLDVALLFEIYRSVSKSNVVVGEKPPVGVANTVYKVPGTNSYADWMYYLDTWYKMAEYDNAIDDEPTLGSNNLVKSGGIAATYGVYELQTEWLSVALDSRQRILGGWKKDGSFEFYKGIPQHIKEYILELVDSGIASKVTKEEGKGLILIEIANIFNILNDDEYIEAEVDSNGKVLSGRRYDGTKVENTGIETYKLETEEAEIKSIKIKDAISVVENCNLSQSSDPEHRVEITLNNLNQVIQERDYKGVLYEHAGIRSSKGSFNEIESKTAYFLSARTDNLLIPYEGVRDLFKTGYVEVNTNQSFGEVFIGDTNNQGDGPRNTKNILIGMHNILNAGLEEEHNPYPDTNYPYYPDRNVAIGYHALFRGYVPKQSIAIGAESLDNVSYGIGNVSIGYSSLRCQRVENYNGSRVVGETVNENTAIGFDSMYYTYGDNNTTLGAHALEGITYGSTGSRNVAIGYCAGKYNNNENDNLFIDDRDRGSRSNENRNSLIVGKFADNASNQFLKINGMFGCNGVTPQAPLTAKSIATDLPSTLLLVNQIRNALIACGIMK